MVNRARGLQRGLVSTLATVLLAGGLSTVSAPPAAAAYAVPPTPAGLSKAVEDLQPYIGQSTCDPVAKPGVSAFRNLLLRTYPNSGSFGIVRDCGAGGQSEHKEGRAFDWKMSRYSSTQSGQVSALLSWLTKTDGYGNKYAMARRLGIMYMIWDRKIWKAYDDRGWRDYTGPNPHTDHVHFSFGWNGSWKTTSYWDQTVAPVNFGPTPPPRVTPVRRFENLALVRQYGGTTLKLPSSGTAVTLVQKALLVKNVDGDYGSTTATHVARFQYDQRLPVTQRFSTAEWRRLFPPPSTPFGAIDKPLFAFGSAIVRGWALDAETTGAIQVSAFVDGTKVSTVTANAYRDDVKSRFPEYGAQHGYDFLLPVVNGTHQVCVTAHNATGTLGSDASLGCATVETAHSPIGALDRVTSALGVVTAGGWAIDPDSTDPVTTSLTVDGAPSAVVMEPTQRTDVGLRFPGAGDGHGVTGELALTEGAHRLCLFATNLPDTLGEDSPLGCKDVKVAHTPVGVLETLRRAPGGVQVVGWALDPDTTGPVTVDLTSDGAPAGSLTASLTRTALSSSYPAQGTAHGFSTVLDLPAGSHSVCAVARNAAGTAGAATRGIGCRTVVVSHNATGVMLALRTVPGGTVAASGTAYDPDTVSPVAVQVHVDGVLRSTLNANRPNASAAARWPGYGSAHGFYGQVGSLSNGWHTFCVRALNAAGTPGVATKLTCRSFVVHLPVGAITSTSRSSYDVTVRGWAVDPDTTTATRVRVYVDGAWRTTVKAGRYRSYLGSVMPGYGSYHGFTTTVRVPSGTHTVCVKALNVDGTAGTNRRVACTTVRVS